MIFLERNILEKVAQIIGPKSAAAQALADADKRIAEGHDVVFVKDGDSILVVDACEMMGS